MSNERTIPDMFSAWINSVNGRLEILEAKALNATAKPRHDEYRKAIYASAPVQHFMPSPGKSLCGADHLGISRTTQDENVTCPHCVRLMAEEEKTYMASPQSAVAPSPEIAAVKTRGQEVAERTITTGRDASAKWADLAKEYETDLRRVAAELAAFRKQIAEALGVGVGADLVAVVSMFDEQIDDAYREGRHDAVDEYRPQTELLTRTRDEAIAEVDRIKTLLRQNNRKAEADARAEQREADAKIAEAVCDDPGFHQFYAAGAQKAADAIRRQGIGH
jgi:hypothetical protein